MINDNTKRKSRIYLAIFGIVVVLMALAAGQFVFIESADAGATQLAGGPENDSALGEALMEMMGRASQDQDVALGAGWHKCNVHMAGPGWGNVYLRLSSPSFSQRWFIARDDQKKEILATGLTAISSKKKIQVYVTATTPTPYGKILACYILN